MRENRVNLYLGKSENLTLNGAILCFFFFFLNNNTYSTPVFSKQKLKMILITCWVNNAVSTKQKPVAQKAERRSTHRFGSVRLSPVLDFLLRSLHHTGIGTSFAYQSPTSAPSVGGSSGVGVSVPVDLVGSGKGLHSPKKDC